MLDARRGVPYRGSGPLGSGVSPAGAVPPRASTEPWAAPSAAEPVSAVIPLPGSKSITNRALVLAALADGPGLIRRPLRARDTALMAAALTVLGTRIDEQAIKENAQENTQENTEDRAWLVTPGVPGGGPAAHDRAAKVDVGNAGTVLRFVPPVAALTGHDTAFDGDPRARERPVGALIAALRELGAVIDDGGRACLPFTVRGQRQGGTIPGGCVTLDASGSSQLVSALLLAGARFRDGVEVRHQGPPVPSAPHIALTMEMLRDAGVRAEAPARDVWRVDPGPVGARTVEVEPDLSNAAPFLAAALVTEGTVTVPGWPARTAQPGDQLRDLLARMGGRCDITAAGLTVRGGGEIHGLTADLRDVSELAPVLAALAALASSPSRLVGIGHMRTHETDRLAALATQINALGGRVSELPDGIAITPRPLSAGDGAFATYDDHRLVMAAAVLGLAVPGLRIENAATVAKTLPEFTRLWTEMLESAP
jgi:3-phosphoshikimate 1-carboxyvinyltransferase